MTVSDDYAPMVDYVYSTGPGKTLAALDNNPLIFPKEDDIRAIAQDYAD